MPRYRILVWAVLAFFVLATRLDDMLADIGWDEATFLQMANEVWHGRLPYVTAFDNKPPAMFFLIGIGQWLFGRTLLVSRLVADGMILIGAIFAFEYLRPRIGGKIALICAALLVAMCAPYFGRQIQSEVIAVPFLLAALMAASKTGDSWRWPFIAGFAMALAILTRTNLAVPALFLGLLYIGRFVVGRRFALLVQVVAYGMGALIPVFALVAVYFRAGALQTFKVSTIDVALAYAGGQYPPWRVAASFVRQVAELAVTSPWDVTLFAIVLIVGMWHSIVPVWRYRSLRDESAAAHEARVMAIMSAGVAVSLCFGGVDYLHYLGQAVPFAVFGWARALAGTSGRVMAERQRLFMWAVSWVFLIVVVIQHVPGSLRYVSHRAEIEAHYPSRRAAAAIAADRRPGDLVFPIVAHGVIWRLDQPPITRSTTHPANLFRASIIDVLAKHGLAADDEFKHIQGLRPRYLIDTENAPLDYFGDRRMEAKLWRDRYYRVWKRLDDLIIYRREVPEAD